jgi:PEP-CTERM motif
VQNTPVLNIASHGFSGWYAANFTYVADATSEVLSFIAQGGPYGLPPADLLSNVSLQSVPEPSTLTLLALGLLGLGTIYLRRRAKRATV